jgi:hypothetical protein
MLTTRANLIETISGGAPDRFVNQFEFMELITEAPMTRRCSPGEQITNEWGITFYWREDQLGSFPLHDAEHEVMKDLSAWRKSVKAPSVDYSDKDWAAAIEHANSVDRAQKFVTAFVAPGLFEMTHYLANMESALVGFYTDPRAMHELLDYLVDYEIRYAKQIIEHIHPDALYHHDDWGGQETTFLSPEMFEEFFVPRYKKIYRFYKENDVELVIHHSDSYAATLVPHMIEMGVDIWQGAMTSNNIPELIKKYGGQISFMAGIDSGVVDIPKWDDEAITAEVERACRENGKLYFIPNLTRGGASSSFPGVYDATSKAIDELSKRLF